MSKPTSKASKRSFTIEDVLKQRGAQYGKFEDQAQIVQDLKDIMHATPNWSRLTADQKECLEMVQHKIGRILNGNPMYKDSWDDIVGYTKLVADTLLSTLEATNAKS